jgi:hypothetical protein
MTPDERMLSRVRDVRRLRSVLVQCCSAVVCCAMSCGAQTADPTATAPNPVTAAPAAKTGTYSIVQGTLLAAPGLAVPNGNIPWALDTSESIAALVPIHHASITEPANVDADGIAASTHTLVGAHAKTGLRTTTPVIFLHTADRTENTGDAGRGNPTGWALVQATQQGNNRIIPHVRFDQIAQGTACAAPLVCLQAESLPDGWLRLSAASPLLPGDYALVPVPRQPRPGVLIVYDFQVDPNMPLARDAVRAGAVPATAVKTRRR